MVLAEKRLDFEMEDETVWETPEEHVATHPVVTVPVLMDGELFVTESAAICEYLEEAYPDIALLPTTPAERAEVRRLVLWFDEHFYHEVTQNLVYEKYTKRMLGHGHPNSDAIRAGKQNLLYHLDYIGELLKGRKWIAGDHLTFADLAAAAHLSVLDFFGDVAWDHNLAVREWYALIKSRPSFRGLLADTVQGVRPPAHYANPDF